MKTKTLDLGCGMNPLNHFNADEVYGVDIVELPIPNTKVADLTIDPIPFEDNFFDYVTGADFIEHVPRVIYLGRERKQPYIDLMSEVWRVLKPGGEALFATPCYPHPETFQDPQHVNYITEKSIFYFCKPGPNVPNTGELKLCQQYGFKGEFELLAQGYRENVPYHLIWHLEAVKNND